MPPRAGARPAACVSAGGVPRSRGAAVEQSPGRELWREPTCDRPNGAPEGRRNVALPPRPPHSLAPPGSSVSRPRTVPALPECPRPSPAITWLNILRQLVSSPDGPRFGLGCVPLTRAAAPCRANGLRITASPTQRITQVGGPTSVSHCVTRHAFHALGGVTRCSRGCSNL